MQCYRKISLLDVLSVVFYYVTKVDTIVGMVCVSEGIFCCKSKVVRVHILKIYRVSGDISPLILYLSSKLSWVVSFTYLLGYDPVLIAGWFLMFWGTYCLHLDCSQERNKLLGGLVAFCRERGRSQWPSGLRRGSVVDRLLGIAGSNPAGGMDVSLLWVLCNVR